MALSLESALGQWVWSQQATSGGQSGRAWRDEAISRAGGSVQYDAGGNVAAKEESDDEEGVYGGYGDGFQPAIGPSPEADCPRTPRAGRAGRRGSDAGSVSSIFSDRTDTSSILGPAEAGHAPKAAVLSALDWVGAGADGSDPTSPAGKEWRAQDKIETQAALLSMQRQRRGLPSPAAGRSSEQGAPSAATRSPGARSVSSSGSARRGEVTDEDLEVLAAMVIDAAAKLRKALKLDHASAPLPSPGAPSSNQAAKRIAERITEEAAASARNKGPDRAAPKSPARELKLQRAIQDAEAEERRRQTLEYSRKLEAMRDEFRERKVAVADQAAS